MPFLPVIWSTRNVTGRPGGGHSGFVLQSGRNFETITRHQLPSDMIWRMRTTVRLRDEVLRRARERAAHEGRTLTSLIEEGLNLVLARGRHLRREPIELPVSNAAAGVLPGVNLNRSADLEQAMTEP